MTWTSLDPRLALELPDRLSERWQDARSSLSQVTEQFDTTLDGVSQQAGQTWDSVSQFPDRARENFDLTADRLSERWSNGWETLSETGDRAQERWQDVVESTRAAGDNLSGVAEFFQTLSDNALVGWLLGHPLWGVLSLLLSVFLLWALFAALYQLVVETWLGLLKSPVTLGRWLLRWGSRQALKGSKGDRQRRKAELLVRLETLQQEQLAVVRELKTLLADNGDSPAAVTTAELSTIAEVSSTSVLPPGEGETASAPTVSTE